jgi:hypothetical protein
MTDYVLINRAGNTQRIKATDIPKMADTDLLLINRGGEVKTITGQVVKEELSSHSGGGNALSPALPPFAGFSSMEMNLTASDGKSEFSLDGIDFDTTLNVPSTTFYYVRYSSDIYTALQGSLYEMAIDVELPALGTTQTQNINFEIDKMPDPFSFTAGTGLEGNAVYETQIFSPLGSINAPTSIWCDGNALDAEINIAGEGWITCPGVPNNKFVERGQTLQLRHKTGNVAETAYETTLFVGYGLVSDERQAATFTSTTVPQSYYPGTLTADTGDEIATVGTTFTLSEARGMDINHTGTDWQVASDASFNTIVDESLDDSTNLNTWQSTATLTADTTYYARARYIDSAGFQSDWNDVGSGLPCVTGWSYFRLIVRMKGGTGGRGWGDVDKNGSTGRPGGTGQLSLITTKPYKVVDLLGEIEHQLGTDGTPGGAGAVGYQANGGAGQGSSGSAGGAGGAGGGASGFSLRMNAEDDYTFMAGVGGGGGGTSFSGVSGGNGASLPAANGLVGGQTGPSTAGPGGVSDAGDPTDPSYNPTPTNGGNASNGAYRRYSSGGGGGWAGGGGGRSGGGSENECAGGGGGASWNRQVGFVFGDLWEVTQVTSGYDASAQQQLASTSLVDRNTNWTDLGTKTAGTRQIKDIAT